MKATWGNAVPGDIIGREKDATWTLPLFHKGIPMGTLLWQDWHYLVYAVDSSWTLFRVSGRGNECWLVSCDPTQPRGDDSSVPTAIRHAIDEALRAVPCDCRSVAEHACGTCGV
jgi:hypothetical protein